MLTNYTKRAIQSYLCQGSKHILRGMNGAGSMATVYLGLGSNLGDRGQQLEKAVRTLEGIESTKLISMSPVYETPPIGGPGRQARYYNAAVSITTRLSPSALLHHTQAIERKFGRLPVTDRQRWAPRPIDLDILFYDRMIVREPGLAIPHPRLASRWFVLKPLSDIAPDFIHPELNKSITRLLQELPEDAYDQTSVVNLDLNACLNKNI